VSQASAELQAAFKDLISTPSTRALLAAVQKEALVPHGTIPASSDFYSDLETLATHLKPNEALYILIRGPNAAPSGTSFTAVTYVPDSAPVRQKMLFASTRLTLTRELGTENFAESFFTTTAEELSPAGWKRHEAHNEAENPLTEEEQNLVDIREAEASEVGGTGRRGAGYGPEGGKTMDAGQGVSDALSALVAGDIVSLKIDATEKVVLVDSSSPVTSGVEPGDVAGHIDKSDPRYTFYGSKDSSGDVAVVFIYTCPSSSKIRDRMVYASSRRSAEALFSKSSGKSLAKKVHATSTSFD